MIIPSTSIINAWLAGRTREEAARAVADLEGLSEAIIADDKVRQSILSPNIDTDRKADLLRQGGLSDLSIKFISWLDKKSSWSDLIGYIAQAKKYLSVLDHTEVAHVVSAVELSSHEKDELKDSLGKGRQKIDLETKIDPKVIGGLVVDIEGKRYDLSLRGRLNQMNKIVNNIQ